MLIYSIYHGNDVELPNISDCWRDGGSMKEVNFGVHTFYLKFFLY